MYSDMETYILDDPFSNLDMETCKFIMTEAILKFLAGKTIILTSHNYSCIKLCDKIYLMFKGRIIDSGYTKKLNEHSLILQKLQEKKITYKKQK